MLTLSHIATHLSTVPHPPTFLTPNPVVYCVYCGVALADPKKGTPKIPMSCPLELEAHEWRQCDECSNIASCLWYYAGHGETYLPRPKLKGASLDIYVWILRESPQDEWTTVPVPLVARQLRYTRSGIAAALTRLRRRGLLEKRTRSGRYGEYRPLIWQRPKGE